MRAVKRADERLEARHFNARIDSTTKKGIARLELNLDIGGRLGFGAAAD